MHVVGLGVWGPLLYLRLHCLYTYLFDRFAYFAYLVLMSVIVHLLCMRVFKWLLLLFRNDLRSIFWRLLPNKCVETLRILVWWYRWDDTVASLLIYFYDIFVDYWCSKSSIRLFAWLDWKTISMWLLFDLHFILIILFLELTLIDNLSGSNLIKLLIR